MLGFFVILGFLFLILSLVTIIGLKSYCFDMLLIFIITWTGESFVDYGLTPDHFPDLLFIYLIFLMSIKLLMSESKESAKAGFYLPGFTIFSMLIATCIVSAIINGTDFIRVALFVRYFLLPYLFFIIVYNLDLNDNEIKSINKFLIFLLITQVLVGTLKWIILPGIPGQFGQESFTGTYATHGGSSHVLIPLIAIGFIVPMYFNRNKKIYLLMFMSFIWYALIGAKRAAFFVLPVFIVPIFYFMKAKFRFRFSRMILTITLIATSLYLIVILNYTFNPEGTIGGSFNLKYVLNYTKNYITGEGAQLGEHYTFGRYASTKRVIKHIINSKLKNLLFGFGPGVALKSGIVSSTHRSFFLSIGIEDGITGFIWMISQAGMLGAGLFIYFLLHLLRLTKRDYVRLSEPYWNILVIGTLGVFLVFLFDFLFYSEAFIRGEYLLFLFFYLTAISLRREKLSKHNSYQE